MPPASQVGRILGEPALLIDVIVTERLDATGIADPSALSTLRTIFQAAPDPTQWAVIGGGSVVLMLLVGWPSSLLNSVVGSRYQQLTMWARRKFRRNRAGPEASLRLSKGSKGARTTAVASSASATDAVASSASATEPPSATGARRAPACPAGSCGPASRSRPSSERSSTPHSGSTRCRCAS